MMSKLAQAIGYGGNSSTGGTGIVSAQDSLVTGDGTQPLSDMNWKKRENKYLGSSSISDKEAKEQKEQRKNQKQIQVKEIKFRPGTDEGDYQVKLRNLKRFLEGGDKVKVTLRFRCREMAHQELGLQLLTRVKNDLEELTVLEFFPRRAEGRQMVMVLAPKNR